jgi:hypothetical protein
MSNAEQVEDAVINEFVSYYLVDELPAQWDDATVDALASDSAERLREVLAGADVAGARALVAAAAENRVHPLHRKVVNSSMIDWVSDRWWSRWQNILRRLAAHLT